MYHVHPTHYLRKTKTNVYIHKRKNKTKWKRDAQYFFFFFVHSSSSLCKEVANKIVSSKEEEKFYNNHWENAKKNINNKMILLCIRVRPRVTKNSDPCRTLLCTWMRFLFLSFLFICYLTNMCGRYFNTTWWRWRWWSFGCY